MRSKWNSGARKGHYQNTDHSRDGGLNIKKKTPFLEREVLRHLLKTDKHAPVSIEYHLSSTKDFSHFIKLLKKYGQHVVSLKLSFSPQITHSRLFRLLANALSKNIKTIKLNNHVKMVDGRTEEQSNAPFTLYAALLKSLPIHSKKIVLDIICNLNADTQFFYLNLLKRFFNKNKQLNAFSFYPLDRYEEAFKFSYKNSLIFCQNLPRTMQYLKIQDIFSWKTVNECRTLMVALPRPLVENQMIPYIKNNIDFNNYSVCLSTISSNLRYLHLIRPFIDEQLTEPDIRLLMKAFPVVIQLHLDWNHQKGMRIRIKKILEEQEFLLAVLPKNTKELYLDLKDGKAVSTRLSIMAHHPLIALHIKVTSYHLILEGLKAISFRLPNTLKTLIFLELAQQIDFIINQENLEILKICKESFDSSQQLSHVDFPFPHIKMDDVDANTTQYLPKAYGGTIPFTLSKKMSKNPNLLFKDTLSANTVKLTIMDGTSFGSLNFESFVRNKNLKLLDIYFAKNQSFESFTQEDRKKFISGLHTLFPSVQVRLVTGARGHIHAPVKEVIKILEKEYFTPPQQSKDYFSGIPQLRIH